MSSNVQKLRGPKTWDAWFLALENHAKGLRAWEYVNPGSPDHPDDALIKPRLPTAESIERKLKQVAFPNVIASGDVEKELEKEERRYDRMIKDFKMRAEPIDQMHVWVTSNIDPVAWNQVTPQFKEDTTLKQKIRMLKETLAPSEEDSRKAASYAYDNVLNTGKINTMKASKWIEKWEEAYALGVRHSIPEIKSALAIEKFLEAVRVHFDEPWATMQQQIIIARSHENQGAPHSLAAYARIFRDVATHKERTAAQVFAIAPPKPENSGSRGRNNNNNERGSHDCPCGRTFEGRGGHKWRPYDCRFVRASINAPASGFTVSATNAKEIVSRLREPKWKQLRIQLSNGGYHLPPTIGNDQTKAQASIDLPDGDLICAFEETGVATKDLLIHSTALQQIDKLDIVASAAGARHRLHNSTIWDTGAALHVVNEMTLLDEGSFYVERGSVGAGDSQCPILGYGTRTLKGDVRGDEKCPDCEELLIAAVEDKKTRSTARSTAPLPARMDEEAKWHLRSGHLGEQALKHLARVRNAEINGTKRLKCEVCARVYAKQVISRRPSERPSPRPFWRLSWDLMQYPLSWDGKQYLFLIRDEFTGNLYAQAIVDRAHNTLFNCILAFLAWVWNQFELRVCVLHHDGEAALVGTHKQSAYQRWAHFSGIELEITPPGTHEPNGGIERANQEVQTKAIAMTEGAGLPQNLWSEVTIAACRLLNISPKKRFNWQTPHEKLYDWLELNSKLPVTQPGSDKRPNWGSLLVYGCRAYALKRDREENRNRKWYKVSPRGHIGYLVGYMATNLYRIWIPVLERVVTTRNVQFDEDVTYGMDKERSFELSIQEIEDQLHEIEELERPHPLPTLHTSPGVPSSGVVEQEADQPHDQPSIPQEEQQPAQQDLSAPDESLQDAEPATQEGAHRPLENHSSRELVGAEAEKPMPSRAQELSGGLPTPSGTPEPDAQESTSNLPTELCPPEPGATEHPMEQLLDQPCEEPSEQIQEVATPLAEETIPAHSQAGVTGDRESNEPRRSSRIGKRKAEGKVKSYANQPNKPGIYATILSNELESVLAQILSDQWNYTSDDQQPLQTVFAVFNAAVKEHTDTGRLAAFPGVTTPWTSTNLPSPPRNWKEMLTHPLYDQFWAAVLAEVGELERMGTWSKVDKEPGVKPIPLKWLFTYKFNPDGTLLRCKARIVVRGDLQALTESEETYAATLAARSFRIIVALAARFGMRIFQFDIKNAFTNAKRDDSSPVMCAMPEGFEELGKVLLLHRALYGLRDSPYLWFQELSGTFKDLGLVQCAEEPCVLYTPDRKVFFVFHVDDILGLAMDADISTLEGIVKGLKSKYKVHEQGEATWFLGIEIVRDLPNGHIYLSHQAYIEKLAHKFKCDNNLYPLETPLPATELPPYEGKASKREIKDYQVIIGSLLYTAVMVRIDIAFAASFLCRFLVNPSPDHMRAAVRVVRYLYATKELSLRFGTNDETRVVTIASDASFSDDLATRRSTQGYVILLYGGPIDWKSSRQTTITTSTTEAELLALSTTAKEAIALRRLFAHMRVRLPVPYEIFCDNQQTIRLVVATNERINTRLRHVDLHNLWLKQEYLSGRFKLTFMATKDMPADGLTKNLPKQSFLLWKAHIGMAEAKRMITGE
ncbi:hypothetical protein MY10362_000299 [Beauveria mimosiformis]